MATEQQTQELRLFGLLLATLWRPHCSIDKNCIINNVGKVVDTYISRLSFTFVL